MRKMLLLFLLCSSVASADTYKCKQGGRTIYSEYPCGLDAVVLTPTYNVTQPISRNSAPGLQPYTHHPGAVPQVVPVPTAKAPITRLSDCKLLETQLAQVRKRLRDGYTVAEDNYLHGLQRDYINTLAACNRRLENQE